MLCVWGREDRISKTALLLQVSFCFSYSPRDFQNLTKIWNEKSYRDLLNCSQQTSLPLSVVSSCWVWFLPFPLNSTHNPCFCQPASAFSFTCCLPARRNGAGGTPWGASRRYSGTALAGMGHRQDWNDICSQCCHRPAALSHSVFNSSPRHHEEKSCTPNSQQLLRDGAGSRGREGKGGSFTLRAETGVCVDKI